MIQYFLHCIRAHASLTAECSKCGIETIFSGVMWIRTNTRKHLSYQYQCQGCGKLKYSEDPKQREWIKGYNEWKEKK